MSYILLSVPVLDSVLAPAHVRQRGAPVVAAITVAAAAREGQTTRSSRRVRHTEQRTKASKHTHCRRSSSLSDTWLLLRVAFKDGTGRPRRAPRDAMVGPATGLGFVEDGPAEGGIMTGMNDRVVRGDKAEGENVWTRWWLLLQWLF